MDMSCDKVTCSIPIETAHGATRICSYACTELYQMVIREMQSSDHVTYIGIQTRNLSVLLVNCNKKVLIIYSSCISPWYICSIFSHILIKLHRHEHNYR